jgi:basic membrane protein A
MKKIFYGIAFLLAGLFLAACQPAETYEIAFVTDIGQLMDGSFNQGTWEGVKEYAEANGKTYKYYQPANGNNATDDDRVVAFEQAIQNGAKIVVAAGFMQANALYGNADLKIKGVAEKYPDVKFVFVDGWAQGFKNVTAIIFQEEQAGYLAGYAAVMEGYTKLGFSGGGGGTNPACQRFGYGFIQGASDAAKEKNITVDMNYGWLHGAGFSASTELQGMLEGWYSNGTQVVFSCGGSMCPSAFAAAAANNGKVIGVDVDQSSQSATVITSAMKGLASGTKHALAEFYAGNWDKNMADKAVNLGAKDNAVGLPTATWKLQNFTVAQYNELFAKLAAGTVSVDSNVEGAETKTYSNVNLNYVK